MDTVVPLIVGALPVIQSVLSKCEEILTICSNYSENAKWIPLFANRVKLTEKLFIRLKNWSPRSGFDPEDLELICHELSIHLESAREALNQLVLYSKSYVLLKYVIAGYVRREIEACILNIERVTVYINSLLSSHAIIDRASGGSPHYSRTRYNTRPHGISPPAKSIPTIEGHAASAEEDDGHLALQRYYSASSHISDSHEEEGQYFMIGPGTLDHGVKNVQRRHPPQGYGYTPQSVRATDLQQDMPCYESFAPSPACRASSTYADQYGSYGFAAPMGAAVHNAAPPLHNMSILRQPGSAAITTADTRKVADHESRWKSMLRARQRQLGSLFRSKNSLLQSSASAPSTAKDSITSTSSAKHGEMLDPELPQALHDDLPDFDTLRTGRNQLLSSATHTAPASFQSSTHTQDIHQAGITAADSLAKSLPDHVNIDSELLQALREELPDLDASQIELRLPCVLWLNRNPHWCNSELEQGEMLGVQLYIFATPEELLGFAVYHAVLIRENADLVQVAISGSDVVLDDRLVASLHGQVSTELTVSRIDPLRP